MIAQINIFWFDFTYHRVASKTKKIPALFLILTPKKLKDWGWIINAFWAKVGKLETGKNLFSMRYAFADI